MTSRSKTSRPRARSRFWQGEDRQRLLVTVGFIGVIAIAALILVVTVAAGYYNDHLAAAVRINGTEISRDRLQDRLKVLTFQIGHLEQQVRDQVAAGDLDANVANQELQTLEAGRGNDALLATAATDLVDETLLGQLGPSLGLSVTPADIDQGIEKSFGSPERRHVLAIIVKPATDVGASAPTDAETKLAASLVQVAATALKNGTDFGTVAKAYSTDPSKDSGGDIGSLTADDTTADPAFLKAVFALSLNGVTDVMQGADGVWRIGKVIHITPANAAANSLDQIRANVSEEAYRAAVAGSLLRQKITDKLVAQASTGSVEQVHAYDILIQANSAASAGAAPDLTKDLVKSSHILFSPKHDATGAATLPDTDPAWAAAKALADAAAAKLRAISDVTQREAAFADMAKQSSDDTSSGASGGDLGFQSNGAFVQVFNDAIFNGTHTKGEIIGPVKSQYGYHVILWEAHRDSPNQRVSTVLDALKQPGADFQALAKANSDGPEASQGGDLGWFARGQADSPQKEAALFALQAGQSSPSTTTLADGVHVYFVAAREQRPVTADQLSAIKTNAFATWYQPQKFKADIWQAPDILAAEAAAAQASAAGG